MKRYEKATFFCSVVLNVLLAVGFLFFKQYVRSTMFKQAALYSNSSAARCRYILSELDCNEPEKISQLEKYLKEQIEINTESGKTWTEGLKR